MHHVLDITKIARLPRLQEDHPAQRPRLEHAEPRPGRPAHQPGDRRRVRARRLVEPADRGQGRSCRAGGRASSPAAARTPASWRRRSTCTSTATTSARTRSRAARSASTRRTARSTGSICSRPARRRSSRGRAATPTPACSARRSWPRPEKGRAGLRGGGQATGAVRDVVQGPAEGRSARTATASRRRCRSRGASGRDSHGRTRIKMKIADICASTGPVRRHRRGRLGRGTHARGQPPHHRRGRHRRGPRRRRQRL